ncbi:TolC family protein [Legionella sp. CNM-4043-24]|uniref:TolC family protein n=1 Tax=Legionella sp. CNM-4043-24 TaxID=3421646 RepID=UPI00403A9BEF
MLLFLGTGFSSSLSAADDAATRLQEAIDRPEYMLKHWIDLPTSPQAKNKSVRHLSLREAILLALRYNPNIQNAELDRIVQRYQLRLAHNEFELQYALAGTGTVQQSRFSDVGTSSNKAFVASPEVNLKTRLGTQIGLNVDNNVSAYNNYTPMITASLTQPLLRGFGKKANEAGLLNAEDSERLNKVMLKQTVIDQITQVISAYRALILSGNNQENQQRQLEDAKKTYDINEKKIAAGQLEPTANIQQSYQIESLSLMVEQANNEFNTAAQNLLQAIGLDPAMRLAVPSDVTVSKAVVPDLKRSIDIALSHNSQYLAQQTLMRADQRAYDVARNQQLWQLDAGASVQAGLASNVDGNSGRLGIYNGRNVTESASLTFTVPINDVSRRSQVINARVKLEQDRLSLIALRRAIVTQVTNSVNSIQSQARRYQLAEKQVKLATQSYELEKKKLQAGISSALDLNNTQNQLIQAQAGLIGAKIAWLNELSALQQFLGTTLDEWQIKLRYGS